MQKKAELKHTNFRTIVEGTRCTKRLALTVGGWSFEEKSQTLLQGKGGRTKDIHEIPSALRSEDSMAVEATKCSCGNECVNTRAHDSLAETFAKYPQGVQCRRSAETSREKQNIFLNLIFWYYLINVENGRRKVEEVSMQCTIVFFESNCSHCPLAFYPCIFCCCFFC